MSFMALAWGDYVSAKLHRVELPWCRAMGRLCRFSWDENKARANLAKHGVSFRLASSIFLDPLALTLFDEAHSGNDERWVTIGRAGNGQILVVVHNADESRSDELRIRIISARQADRREISDYEDSAH